MTVGANRTCALVVRTYIVYLRELEVLIECPSSFPQCYPFLRGLQARAASRFSASASTMRCVFDTMASR